MVAAHPSSVEGTLSPRRVRRRYLAAAAVLLLPAGTAMAIWRLNHPTAYEAAVAKLGPTGDPGGRILAQLRPLRSIVPPGAVVNYFQFQEPHPDSCDGNPSTVGWDPVTVNSAFTVNSATSPVDYVSARLQQLGWKMTEPGVRWTKTLKSDGAATGMLDLTGGTWEFVATVPAIGPSPTGC